MKRYYANLLGQWTDITDDGLAENEKVSTYFQDNLTYDENENVARCFKGDYINITYGEKSYRIHPSCIQIVTM